MKLDVPTLAVILSLTSFAQVIALWVQFRINRAHRGIGWWLGGASAMALGFTFLFLGGIRGIAPLGSLGNPLLILGRACLFVGTLQFVGQRENRFVIAATILGFTLLYFYYLFITPSITLRTVTVSAAIGLFSLLTARLLFSSRNRSFAASARFTGGVFLLHGAYLALNILVTLGSSPIHSYLEFSRIQSLAFVVPALTSTLWTFGFILMMNQRLGAATLEGKDIQKAESLGRMAGAIAHHFNNQLQSVMANLELLERLPGKDAAACLAKAKLATERAAEVSRLMLVYLGQTAHDQEPHRLADLCRDGAAALRAALPKTVALELEAGPGPVASVNADQFRQVLGNLVTNAWEAMDGAAGSIRISLGSGPGSAIAAAHRFPVSWRPQAPDYAWVEVRDTGCGIRAADIENLFDPFFSTRFTGRGLGLPVALGIVQAHGGAITVQSSPGQGSCFRIHLPVAPAPAPAPPGPALPPRLPAGGGTILLVDDDESVLVSTGGLLEMLGFTLLTARDGVEALALFRQAPEAIRCVVTDLTMPHMDGWETLAALRRLRPGLPVVLASGYDRALVMAGSHPDLPQAFLAKPFDLDQLRDALGLALG